MNLLNSFTNITPKRNTTFAVAKKVDLNFTEGNPFPQNQNAFQNPKTIFANQLNECVKVKESRVSLN